MPELESPSDGSSLVIAGVVSRQASVSSVGRSNFIQNGLMKEERYCSLVFG